MFYFTFFSVAIIQCNFLNGQYLLFEFRRALLINISSICRKDRTETNSNIYFFFIEKKTLLRGIFLLYLLPLNIARINCSFSRLHAIMGWRTKRCATFYVKTTNIIPILIPIVLDGRCNFPPFFV